MDKVKIYDTNSRELQTFKPISEDNVKMYVCGPTVYDLIHIGNARPIVVFDVLYRLLKSIYPKVTYVRNITDVDDKINARAKKNKESIGRLTSRTTKQFINDYKALGTLEPDVQPKATEHISEMIEIIEKLITNNHAYKNKGHVLFLVKSWEKYGEFAKKYYDKQVAGARVEIASYKKDPADFVLWKPSKNDEPGWESPWGYGRPGWHIECSAMSKKHLGENFDIHGGGLDLIFPHHQNEIAQSCCSNKSGKFANYWMHNGFLMSEGQKMSKSLGNFYTVSELLNDYDGLAIRLVLLSTHYTKPLDFTKFKLNETTVSLKKISDALQTISDVELNKNADISDFINALCEDLNTPLALSILWQYRKNLSANKTPETAGKFIKALDLIGIMPNIQNNTENHLDAVLLANERLQAKNNKDWHKADELRGKIKNIGYEILDTPEGYSLRKI